MKYSSDFATRMNVKVSENENNCSLTECSSACLGWSLMRKKKKNSVQT